MHNREVYASLYNRPNGNAPLMVQASEEMLRD